MQNLLCTFADLDSRYQSLMWFSRVPSASNIADDPSRLLEPVIPEGWTSEEFTATWPVMDKLGADRASS
eukprot:1392423-Amphidinium_carterae.1